MACKVNAENPFFRNTETKYLGLWVSKNGVRPLSFKAYYIKTINVPTKLRDVRRFVGLMNYYRDMWRKRSHTLASLNKLFYTKVKFILTDVEHKYFTKTNKIVGRDFLLTYNNSSE